jgi:hypothetical protein
MIVETSRLACPSSRQSNPPQPRAPLLHACFVLCQSDGSDAPISRIQPPGLASSLGPWPSDGCDAPIFRIQPSGLASTSIFGFLAKRRLWCTNLPTKPNRQDWLLLGASLGPFPSDGCDAPIFRIQPSGLASTSIFGFLAKRRLWCTNLPTKPNRQDCLASFWSLTKRRLRCTNLPKPNGQGLASSTTRMHLLVLAKVTAEMHQFFQNQPPGCTHVWQRIGYLHIAPFVLETENSFSPPEFKFCSLSSNYFYLFTG